VWIYNAKGMALPEILGSCGFYSLFIYVFFGVGGLPAVNIA